MLYARYVIFNVLQYLLPGALAIIEYVATLLPFSISSRILERLVLDVLSFVKMNYHDNVQMFINVPLILPTGDQKFGSHDRPHYNRICFITRNVITRSNCGSFDWYTLIPLTEFPVQLLERRSFWCFLHILYLFLFFFTHMFFFTQ